MYKSAVDSVSGGISVIIFNESNDI